jgi:hypothetical protein
MKMSGFKPSVGSLGMALLLCSCEHRVKQFEAEAHAIFGLQNLLKEYEAVYPGVRVTNVSQLFIDLDRSYPHEWHQQFNGFGNTAGFTNSIYEKYVFFPSGITNPKFEGELLLMNAKPYPSPKGEMERSLVSKSAGVHHWITLREDRIQQFFKEAGIAEPKPVVMSPPSPAPPETDFKEPVFSKLRGFVLGFLQVNGIGASAAWAIWCILCSLPFVLLTLMLLWMWHRGRR